MFVCPPPQAIIHEREYDQTLHFSMSKRGGSSGDVNLSPMSDRGAPSTGGFAYLKPQPVAPRPRGGVEVVVDLPASVTRRAPGGKRTLTPRGNPFASDAEGIRRPLVAARGKQRVDPFAGATVVEAVPGFGLPSEPASSSPPSMTGGRASIPQKTPSPIAAMKHRSATPPQRSPSGGRRPSKSAASPTSAVAAGRKSTPVGHVPIAALLASMEPPASGSKRAPSTPVPTDANTHQHTRVQFPTSEDDIVKTAAPRGSVTFVHVRRGASLCFQLTGVAVLAIIMILGAVVFAAPLFIRFDSPEDALVRDFVPSVSQLQNLYQQPVLGLNESETRCLYLRVLEDRQEALERALAPFVANLDAATTDQQVLRLEQVARAHHMLRHRVRLYARSRDSSILNQLIFYPFRDPFVYGLVRHGWGDTLFALFWKPDVSDLLARVQETAVCMRQSEHMPCPSYALIEEKAVRAVKRRQQLAGASITTPLDHAKAVTNHITDRSARSNSWYNDKFCSALYREKQRTKSDDIHAHAAPSLG
jgi:hypothetical protein